MTSSARSNKTRFYQLRLDDVVHQWLQIRRIVGVGENIVAGLVSAPSFREQERGQNIHIHATSILLDLVLLLAPNHLR
jgi:hypothetical protein